VLAPPILVVTVKGTSESFSEVPPVPPSVICYAGVLPRVASGQYTYNKVKLAIKRQI
jgi:hypothetical protein